MATIDRADRRYVLFLNDHVAQFSRLAASTSNAAAKGVYLSSMLAYQGDLDRAVFAAMQRAGDKPVIGSCAGCYAAGRAAGYEAAMLRPLAELEAYEANERGV